MLEWQRTGDTLAASADGLTYTIVPLHGLTNAVYLLLSGLMGSWGHVFATLDAAIDEAEQTAIVYRRIRSLQTGGDHA